LEPWGVSTFEVLKPGNVSGADPISAKRLSDRLQHALVAAAQPVVVGLIDPPVRKLQMTAETASTMPASCRMIVPMGRVGTLPLGIVARYEIQAPITITSPAADDPIASVVIARTPFLVVNRERVSFSCCSVISCADIPRVPVDPDGSRRGGCL
jgi:hypothetical protein